MGKNRSLDTLINLVIFCLAWAAMWMLIVVIVRAFRLAILAYLVMNVTPLPY